MGGKKLAEKNRKYEKDRRNRFNNQFVELSKLLPEFSSVIKVTKAEIITKAIQYLQETQDNNKKLENDYETEKNKILELQKKVTRLLQVIKELMKLLQKSNINFPASLLVDDLKSFKEELKFKRKHDDDTVEEDTNKKNKTSPAHEYLETLSDLEELTNPETSTVETETPATSKSTSSETDSPPPQTISTTVSNSTTASQTTLVTSSITAVTPTVMNVGTSNMLSSLILPSGNLLAVNGLPNAVINTPPTLFLNKQVTVPTFIVMQNNSLIPVPSVKPVVAPPTSQKCSLQKLIVPKHAVMSTKTTFINKKPIPAVGLYKSSNVNKESSVHKGAISNAIIRRVKRSKGILVRYPKRRPPGSKKSTAEVTQKPSMSEEKPKEKEPSPVELPNKEDNAFTNIENSFSVSDNNFAEGTTNSYAETANDANTYAEASNVIDKNYTCSDNIFDTQDTQHSSEFGSKAVQFIDFFESSSTRSNNSDTSHAIDSSEFVQNGESSKLDKSLNEHLNEICSVKNSFVSENSYCNLIEPSTEKESSQLKSGVTEKSNVCLEVEPKSHPKSANNYHQLAASCVSADSVLLAAQPVSSRDAQENQSVLKSKIIEKGAPLTIQCSISENKSISKELTLPLIEEKKNYESVSSFDELSSDLFTTLQVPSSGQNTDSISPTAAFLLTFPYVSSCKNVDLLPEHEHEEDNTSPSVIHSTTLLQIGNLESPSTPIFPTSTKGKSYSCGKPDENGYYETNATNENSSSSAQRKEKMKDKESEIGKQFSHSGRSDTYFNDTISFASQSVNKGASVSVSSQNMPFYPSSCGASTFPSYTIFTKYNEIPPVASSYYTLGSQSFPTSKVTAADPIPDFNSWVSMPSAYGNQDTETVKEKTKRDKCTSTHSSSFRNGKLNDFATFGLPQQSELTINPTVAERSKAEKMKKPSKQSNGSRLVNWMTAPDLKNSADTSQSPMLTDTAFMLQKDDSSLLNNANMSNNVFGNVTAGTYSSTSDYYLENQNYSDTNMSSCKSTYSCANSTNYTWTTTKPSLPPISHMDTHNMIIPSTLPTLVGDLALNNSNNVNTSVDKIFSYEQLPKKYNNVEDKSKKENDCGKGFYKSTTHHGSQSSFLSVTQLVDDKDEKFASAKAAASKASTSKHLEGTSCHYESDLNREKCNFIRNNKENYTVVLGGAAKNAEKNTATYTGLGKSSESTSGDSLIKTNQNATMKCKVKENLKYNVNRCISKENGAKKDTRQSVITPSTQTHVYGSQNNPSATNPLTNKNSNYSAESLISSSNHQNVCTPTQYFSYDNGSGYGNCMGNEYSRKNESTTEPVLANVGYYTNTNYVYPNNFQTFNNYSFSNQCYNNYSSPISSHTTSTLQKKNQKEEAYQKPPPETVDWCKETSFHSNYNNMVGSSGGDFVTQNNRSENKCKQPFSNNKYSVQKNSSANLAPTAYNSKYYQYGASSSTSSSSSTIMNNAKSSCSFNSAYAFSQTSQQCVETSNCAVPNYEMKTNRNNSAAAIVNSGHSNNVHSATSLTNFNLSAIFPEINDKHCNQNRLNNIGNEKKDTSYGNNKSGVEDMNYSNYIMQPSMENNQDLVSVYGAPPPGFQIQHFTNFSQRKSQK